MINWHFFIRLTSSNRKKVDRILTNLDQVKQRKLFRCHILSTHLVYYYSFRLLLLISSAHFITHYDKCSRRHIFRFLERWINIRVFQRSSSSDERTRRFSRLCYCFITHQEERQRRHQKIMTYLQSRTQNISIQWKSKTSHY